MEQAFYVVPSNDDSPENDGVLHTEINDRLRVFNGSVVVYRPIAAACRKVVATDSFAAA